MDYNSKKDFNNKQQSNRNNDAYFNNQEQNTDLPYNLINKPKIPMSYYFPEGNQRVNFNQKHSEEEMHNSQYYIQKDPGYFKSNLNKTNDDILANALQMGGVNMNNINNMNINIFNQVPVNPQNNYSMLTNKNSEMENDSFIENFGGLNVNSESRSHNIPNKKTIAYNYYFGGEGGSNFDIEKEQNVSKDNNYANIQNTPKTIYNNNYQYMPSMHSVQYNNFPKNNAYNSNSNNNTPTHYNYLQPSYHDYTHNNQIQNVGGASNMIPDQYPAYNERNKNYENNRNANEGMDMEEVYLNNKYDNIPRNIQNSSLNMPNQHSARYFILKSADEENIHKSIKYRIWCSTIKGNQKLQKAFKDADNKYPIYLFFSVNGSGRFLGLAQMTSEVEYRANFNYWTQNEKWRGFFFVVWLIIKDVPNKLFRNLINEYNENKPVTSSRDTQEIQPDAGAEMLRIFKEYNYESSILDEFNFYEKRQVSSNNMNQKNQIKNIPNMEEIQNNNKNYANRNNNSENFNNPQENTVELNFNEPNFKNSLQDSKYNVGNQNIKSRAFGISKANEVESNSFPNFPQNHHNSFDANQRDNLDNLIEKDCGVSEIINKKPNNASQNNLFKEKPNRVIQNQFQNNSTKRILKRINSTDNIIKVTGTKNSDEE